MTNIFSRLGAMPSPRAARCLALAWKAVWLVAVLTWPLFRWVLSLDVTYQLARMVYYWDTPGVYAGWTFALHFLVLTGMTFFVSSYKPKG